MLSTLLIVAIVASTFLTGIYLDPFFPPISDSRDAKSFICWIACLLIGVYGFKNLSLIKKNVWISAFVFYVIATVSIHPAFRIRLGDIDLNGFWMAPVLLQMTGFFFMYLTIANASEKIMDPSALGGFRGELDIKKIFKVIFYCGFFSACYIFIQAIKFDQFFVIMPSDVVLGTPQASLTSFIGQKCLAAAFIAMTIPFGFYFKRYFFMALMAGAVILTMCKMAIASLIVGAIFYFVLRSKKAEFVFGAIILSLVLIVAGAVFVKSGKIHIQDNGRFQLWKEVLHDFNSPQIVNQIPKGISWNDQRMIEMSNKQTWQLTGIGPGSYSFVFVSKHKSIWKQIHNEFLEVLYAVGVIGFIIFLFIISSTILKGIWNSDQIEKCILTTSFIIICLNAFTNFVWQVDPTRFLTVLIIGLI